MSRTFRRPKWVNEAIAQMADQVALDSGLSEAIEAAIERVRAFDKDLAEEIWNLHDKELLFALEFCVTVSHMVDHDAKRLAQRYLEWENEPPPAA